MTYKVALLIGLLSVLAYRLYCRQRQRSEVARNYGCGTVVQHRPLEPFTGFDFQMRMHVGTLVSHPAIITVAKENLHAINTSNEFGVEPMRLPGMEYFCGKGFITTDGDTWNHSKRLLRPSFDRSNLRDLSILRDEVDTLIKSLPKDGSVADLQPLLYTTFLNSALYFVLGVHPSEISKDAPLTADQFVKSFHDALVYSMFRTLLGRAWKFLPQAKYIQACATAHNFVDFYVEKAVQEQEQEDMPLSKRSLIRSLSSQTNDKEYIRSQVIQAMMAAQDTTSELLTNAFFLLARNAEYWTRLRAEITEAGDGIFEVDRLTSSKLISNILFETLRICPIFPLIGRIALSDTKLPVGGGPKQDLPVFIPQGTMVVMSYYSVHRNKTIFGNDVEVFRPDRWNDIHPAQWEFMGFGAGNRTCLGKQKAQIEASYVLARFAQAFERIESRDDRDWQGELKLTCKSKNGCKVAFS